MSRPQKSKTEGVRPDLQSADLDVQPVKVAEEVHGNVSGPHAKTQAGAAKCCCPTKISCLLDLWEERTNPFPPEKLYLYGYLTLR